MQLKVYNKYKWWFCKFVTGSREAAAAGKDKVTFYCLDTLSVLLSTNGRNIHNSNCALYSKQLWIITKRPYWPIMVPGRLTAKEPIALLKNTLNKCYCILMAVP